MVFRTSRICLLKIINGRKLRTELLQTSMWFQAKSSHITNIKVREQSPNFQTSTTNNVLQTVKFLNTYTVSCTKLGLSKKMHLLDNKTNRIWFMYRKEQFKWAAEKSLLPSTHIDVFISCKLLYHPTKT